MKRLIKLLRACQSDSPMGHSIRTNIRTKPDQLIEELRSQAQDDPAIMCRIIGIEACELLLGSKLEVRVRVMGVEYWRRGEKGVAS